MKLASFFFIFILFLGASSKAGGPYCPTTPKGCNFSTVQTNLQELKEDRLLGLLKSPDASCRAAISKGIKPENVLPELIADPRFVVYLSPQITQCWKEGGSNAAKLETLSRYAYLQKRMDESAGPMLDYLVYADSILGQAPLSTIANCADAAPELSGFMSKCKTLKDSCPKTDMAQQVAKSFVDEYKNQDIKKIEDELSSQQKKTKLECSKARGVAQCKVEKDLLSKIAARLQVFYANFPWAHQETFRDLTKRNGFEDLDSVVKAMKTQISENSKSMATQLKEITDTSKCLLRGSCSSDQLNKTLQKTNPLADQIFIKKREARESFYNRAEVSSYVSYNNCLDDLGDSQRRTATTLITSGVAAAGALLTMGGSLVVTGLGVGARSFVGAAATGSRIASAGKTALTMGQMVDAGVASHSLLEATNHCGKRFNGTARPNEKQVGPVACGIPTAAQMNFRKEYDGCLMDVVLAGAGLGSLAVGLRASAKANQIAKSNEAADAAAAKAAAAAVATEKAVAQTTTTTQTAGKTTTGTAAAKAEEATLAAKAEESGAKAGDASGKATSGTSGTSNPLETVSSGKTGETIPAAALREGDQISVQLAGGRSAAMVLQTQSVAGQKSYQIVTKNADGTLKKTWVSQKELDIAKPRFSDKSAETFGAVKMNKELATSAIRTFERGGLPETVRGLVGKLKDEHDGGAARMEIAKRLLGRTDDLSEAEVKWIMAAHKQHADTKYGKIGSEKVRDKIKAGEGRPRSIDDKQTRILMENGILGTEKGLSPAKPVSIVGSKITGETDIVIVNRNTGQELNVRIIDSYTGADGQIYHRIQMMHNGEAVAKDFPEASILAGLKPKPEIPVTPPPAPRIEAPPTVAKVEAPIPVAVRPEPRPLNPSAANDIEALNQAQMKTVTGRVSVTNGKDVPQAQRRREVYADNLGIKDPNRRAAIDYPPIVSAQPLESAIQKALGPNTQVNATQLRQALSFNPGKGYVTQNEFANAARFVEEINAMGGIKALDKLPLSSTEREALNAVMARAPAYASYVDSKVRPLGQLKISNAPADGTKMSREVVVTDGTGRTHQGVETFRQAGPDGQTISHVKVTNPDGTSRTIVTSTSKTEDLETARRVQNFDANLTARANAATAARVEATEQASYINVHGVPRKQIQSGREGTAIVHAVSSTKPVEIQLSGVPYRNVNGQQEVQVRYNAAGPNSKPDYRYANVSIDEVHSIKKPVQLPSSVPTEPFSYNPYNPVVRKPPAHAVNEATTDGRKFRMEVDQEATDILIHRQIGNRAHAHSVGESVSLERKFLDSGKPANNAEANAVHRREINSPFFNPKAFYKDASDRYYQTRAPKSEGAEQASITFRGVLDYSTGKEVRKRTAEDVAVEAAKIKGATEKEIADLRLWIKEYETAAERVRQADRAVEARRDLESLSTVLSQAQQGTRSVPISGDDFKKLAQSLNDMKLTPDKRKDAEVALKKIRCSRPEWKITAKQFSSFDLSCD